MRSGADSSARPTHNKLVSQLNLTAVLCAAVIMYAGLSQQVARHEETTTPTSADSRTRLRLHRQTTSVGAQSASLCLYRLPASWPGSARAQSAHLVPDPSRRARYQARDRGDRGFCV